LFSIVRLADSDRAALQRMAITESRKIKTSIPELGLDDIPIRDEIELELRLPPPNPGLCT